MSQQDVPGPLLPSRTQPFRRTLLGAAALLAVNARAGSPGTHSALPTDRDGYLEARRMKELAESWGDQSYGAVVVLHGQVIGYGPSRVIKDGDPDAHAERVAIREALKRGAGALPEGAVLYSTSRPCPACEQVAARAGVTRMVFGESLQEAAPARARSAVPAWREWHHRVRNVGESRPTPVVLTLDACGGGYDARLIGLLVEHRIPATLFVTVRWLDRNPSTARELLTHADLFELQNHGTQHVPAIVAPTGRLYGMAVQPDIEHLRGEVTVAAERIRALTGKPTRWFRGAGAAYDENSVRIIDALGHRIAGFSVNADAGATLSSAGVAARLRAVRPGDIVLAHMNHPGRGTAAGLAQVLPVWHSRGLRFARLSDVDVERLA